MTAWRGIPDRIRVDNGSEFIAATPDEWYSDKKREIKRKFIQKGKPSQNGYIERLSRSYREEILSAYLFESLFFNKTKLDHAPSEVKLVADLF